MSMDSYPSPARKPADSYFLTDQDGIIASGKRIGCV
jgi:hypothetical protein